MTETPHTPQLAVEAPPSPRIIEANPAAGKELVPLKYERQAWNEVVTTVLPDFRPLPHHDSQLTAEQATQINEHLDVELNFGTHGFGIPGKPDGMRHVDGVTTQKEYDAVQQVIDGLEEGDTLLVEGRGFLQNPPKVPTQQELSEVRAIIDAIELDPAQNVFEQVIQGQIVHIGRTMLQLMSEAKYAHSQQARQQANVLRQAYLGSAWAYAVLLAQAKGVRVVYADYDAFQHMKAAERSGKSAQEQMMSTDPADKQQFAEELRLRDLAARNIAKDLALDNLPPEGTPPAGRKRKLSVLFGRYHMEHMAQAFEQLGIHTRLRELEGSTQGERFREHFIRDVDPSKLRLPQPRLAELRPDRRSFKGLFPRATRRTLGFTAIASRGRMLDSRH